MLATCVFLALLSSSKVVMVLLLCTCGLILLWTSSSTKLNNRQFNLWFEVRDAKEQAHQTPTLKDNQFLRNLTLQDKLDAYCE